MITTVTLNPAIDMTVYLDSLRAGETNRASRTRSDVGGKGINVSVVLRAFRLSTLCTGISFDGNGSQLYSFLDEQCIAHYFAVARGNIRTNIKIMDETANTMTEINSSGDRIDKIVIADYLERLTDTARRSRMLVLSGRLPNGGDDDLYHRSLEAVKEFGLFTVIDAEKEPLKQALLAKPTLIKPNVHELEDTFGCKIHSKRDAADACRDIIKQGVKIVCCSMGGDGAVIAEKKKAWFSPAMPIEVKGLQGAGDSMVAGMCKAAWEKRGADDMLRFGMAAAAASLIREGTQLCRYGDFERLLPQVKLQTIR